MAAPMFGLGRRAGWPASLIGMVALVLVVGLPVGGYYGYRAYDFVEHDNDFCMSCHLMEGPFEAFAKSEHRGLGCKACHQPTLMGRSQMALTQVVEQPDELQSHAEVPDEVCANCHIEGDPEKWRLISESGGHRIHLDTTNESLRGVTCVGCHSSSVHEFSATDQTCAQSDCHTDTEIHLGRMGDFTIHCVACHAFRAPLPAESTVEDVRAALRPDQDECLSCHVMRALVDLPPDEPHDGVCASCHNPHTQGTAAEAQQTCVNAGCHEVVEDSNPSHVGINALALQDCSACHVAHDFRLDGSDCRACHTDGVQTSVAQAGALQTSESSTPASPATTSPRAFDHETHTSVGCESCHVSEESHGQITVTTPDQCQTCHHQPETAQDCTQCHQGAESLPAQRFDVVKPVRLSVGETSDRALPFAHSVHASQDCSACHTGSLPNLDATALDCTACHQEHHTPESACVSCHVQAPVSVHPVEQVHLGCSGAGCHTGTPFSDAEAATPPRTRDFCLTCHQELQDHRVERNCVECHTLPTAGG